MDSDRSGDDVRSVESHETTLTDSYTVTVPAAVRDRLGLRPGDELRWTVAADGDLGVEVVDREAEAVGPGTNGP